MATKAQTAAPAPSPSTNTNLRLWDKLGKTDPRHTKPFTRGGGFKGTAMKPMWQNKLLTETFGPCGVGWGFAQPEFQTMAGSDGEMLVYCIVNAWYIPDPEHPDDVANVFGVGGDKVIAKFSSGPKSDDEAFKKAFTDAIGNAFKFIGVGADVHMGQFDDSKYVQDVRREFEAGDDHLGTDMGKLVDEILETKNLAELKALLPKCKDLAAKLNDDDRVTEADTLVGKFNDRLAALKPKAVESPQADTVENP